MKSDGREEVREMGEAKVMQEQLPGMPVPGRPARGEEDYRVAAEVVLGRLENDGELEDLLDVIRRNPWGSGYELAKALDDHHMWEIDHLVLEELELVGHEIDAAYWVRVAAWVEAYGIKPDRAVGDRVTLETWHERKRVTVEGEIVAIKEAEGRYTVCCESLGHVPPSAGVGVHGVVKNYEDVRDVATSGAEAKGGEG